MIELPALAMQCSHNALTQTSAPCGSGAGVAKLGQSLPGVLQLGLCQAQRCLGKAVQDGPAPCVQRKVLEGGVELGDVAGPHQVLDLQQLMHAQQCVTLSEGL